MQKFHGRGEAHGSKFSTMVQGTPIVLTTADVSYILGTPNVGWDHIMHHEWPPLENIASALKISRKFSKDAQIWCSIRECLILKCLPSIGCILMWFIRF